MSLMKFFVALTFLAAAGCLSPSLSAAGSEPAEPVRLKRAESFFGVHFDFHARGVDRGIGRHTSPAMIERFLDEVRPDFVEVDCKGHLGIASYPTALGNAAPEIAADLLRIWRDVTAARGVGLYVHYSGVIDYEAVARHQDWAAVDAQGQPSNRATSLFSPYADQLFIPQLQEVATRYGIDGVWVDGDCWGVVPDYSERALAAFRTATGIKEAPRQANDPHWPEFIAFHRQSFRDYLRRYLGVLRATHPQLQVTSNWAYSDHMPEPVEIDLPFLSGDFATQNSVNSARFTGRVFEGQGRPWELMSWCFTWLGGAPDQRPPGNHPKTPVQLKQEVSTVLARGGGVQLYYSQQADGSIYEWQVPIMAEVARYCRERQAFSHRAVAVPQVALLFSAAAHYRQSTGVFKNSSPTITAARGILQNLLDCQQSVQVVSEHHLRGRMAEWPLIVVPEVEQLEPAFRAELIAYARNGGRLLLIGPKAAADFADELGLVSLTPAAKGIDAHLSRLGQSTPMVTSAAEAVLAPDVRAVGRIFWHDNHRENPDLGRGRHTPAASFRAIGRGQIGAIYLNLSDRYMNARTVLARDFLGDVVRSIWPDPIVTVEGSHAVDVSVMRQEQQLCVHLVNTSGPHENPKHYTFDEIPALGPLIIDVRLDRAPVKVTVIPDRGPHDFVYESGRLRLKLPRLAIHEIIVIEP